MGHMQRGPVTKRQVIELGINLRLKTGTLYAVGVGPGDPELLTIKGRRVLEEVSCVFSATSKGSRHSLALDIASPFLKSDAKVIPLVFPMVRDKKLLERAWQDAAKKVIEPLGRGANVAFVTLGDPCTYSTFTYLHRTLLSMEDRLHVEIIPGITSFQAAAARIKTPLSEGEESLSVVSGAKGSAEIEKIASCTDNLVIMKAYRHYNKIVKCLEKLGLLDKTVAVRRVGLQGESVTRRLKEWNGDKASYFTLLLAKKENRARKLHNS